LNKQQKIIKQDERSRGISLIEALISMAILSIVIVSLLSGFAQNQMITQRSGHRNAAIMLAESQMENLLKFSSTQLATENFVEYVIVKNNRFEFTQIDPKAKNQFRRTTKITKDLMQQVATIQVIVDYGAAGDPAKLHYPFNVELITRRTIK